MLICSKVFAITISITSYTNLHKYFKGSYLLIMAILNDWFAKYLPINLYPYTLPKKISIDLKMRFVSLHDISFGGKNGVNPLRKS